MDPKAPKDKLLYSLKIKFNFFAF